MTAKTATATHRVFEAIQGLWPVTFANVREADPAGLLDIFEGAENTRDAYFEAVTDYIQWVAGKVYTYPGAAVYAGRDWADSLQGFDTDHTDECYFSTGSHSCRCKEQQWFNNQQWGQELWEAIQQRIRELNG